MYQDSEAATAAQLLSSAVWQRKAKVMAIGLSRGCLGLFPVGTANYYQAVKKITELEAELAELDLKLKAAAAVYKVI